MSLKPSTAILKRFSSLQARNLLYMQAELCRLENELLKLEQADSKSDEGHRKNYAADYEWLRLASLNFEQGKKQEQARLLGEIRRALREYSKWRVLYGEEGDVRLMRTVL
jgi:hypothetical protein